jgi:chromosome segregation ATPase
MIREQRLRPYALSLVLLSLLACKTTDKSAATGESITKAADQIERGIQELDATVAALHDLTEKPADMAAQRKTFEKALGAAEKTAASVSETAADLSAKGQAYFQEWDLQLASIQNEDIRERSADRRKAIEASFSELQEQHGEAKTAFEPLLSDLRDMRTALKADLTLEGVDALKPEVKDIDKEAKSVREELTDLAEHFRELGVGLKAATPPPAPPKS